MSMHKTPLTPTEEAGLRAHGLDIGKPSQLSDAFRQGVAWGQKTQVVDASSFERLDAAKAELRSDYRLKLNTDYALTVKYGEVHVLSHDVFEDAIREVFAKHAVAIKTLNTYP